MSKDILYFGAGPALLPTQVKTQVQTELLDYQGSGLSILELGHRTSLFKEIAERSTFLFRELLKIPTHYRVLFLHGGATSQFAQIPMNLLGNRTSADYLVTGHWSRKAAKEAERFCHVNLVASSESQGFNCIPERGAWSLSDEAAYVYYTANETIKGVEFSYVPEVTTVPLVSDMTSSLLTCPMDIEKFGLVFAGTQKNLGTAGLCVVIVREDLTGHAVATTPSLWDYQNQIMEDSIMNTPPIINWYVTGLVLEWIRDQGGVEQLAAKNQHNSARLYAAIDASELYVNDVKCDCRSRVNVSFRLINESLNETFLKEAENVGLVGLKGHRSVGGMRASLYNAMPAEGVERLIQFMLDFEQRYA